MVFSSTVFLFIFLPFVLFVNFLTKPIYRNFFLLIVSLLFYAWGEGAGVLLMLLSCGINYIGGLGVTHFRSNAVVVKWILGVAIAANLFFLFYYKYWNFFLENIPFGHSSGILFSSVVLPIGISFYTFHGISYLVDIYRKNTPALKNPIDLGLYIAFFPQLIAGPIVRYSDIVEQLRSRQVTTELLFQGTIRFIRGLAKKIIIANVMGQFVDTALHGRMEDLPFLISWLCILCYSLQIYYDFSGYSDMAIGLAKMFGFHFKENFNHPYIATSIQDFWRRWHISLSSWFRDYVYIPLGGNQKGPMRTYVNLFIVFFITGLWHGASWNFVIWGLFHGAFLILERRKIINAEKLPRILRHLYTLFVVVIGWVFFRFESFSDAVLFLQSLAGINHGHDYNSLVLFNPYFVFVFAVGTVLCTPIRNHIYTFWQTKCYQPLLQIVLACFIYIVLFMASLTELAQSSYNPFIYFRF